MSVQTATAGSFNGWEVIGGISLMLIIVMYFLVIAGVVNLNPLIEVIAERIKISRQPSPDAEARRQIAELEQALQMVMTGVELGTVKMPIAMADRLHAALQKSKSIP